MAEGHGQDEPRAWLEALAEGRTWAWSPAGAEAVARRLSALRPREPDDLVRGPGRPPDPLWHLRCLRTRLERGRASRDPERTRYHARWLLHLLAPDDPAVALPVSVVIPVYNLPELLAEAVESCFAQTHSAVEVVVVDDGSTETPGGALRPLARRCGSGRSLRIVRQPNTGPAGARTRGIAEASGTLVRLLDADDVLDPDALERQIVAMGTVPEAEVCVAPYRAKGLGGIQVDPDHKVPRLGDAFCPTRDLLATWVRRYPFHTSSVLAPRYLFLEVGPWDGDLSNSFTDASDSAYWLRLALSEVRVVAVGRPIYTRRFRPGSLTTHEPPLGHVVLGRALASLLEHPARWPYLGPLLRRLRRRERWLALAQPDDGRAVAAQREILRRLQALGDGKLVEGYSPGPLLTLLADHLRAVDDSAFTAGLRAAVEAGRAAAPAPSVPDLRLWLGGPADPAPPEENAPALYLVVEWLDAEVRRGGSPVPREDLADLAGRAPGHPASRRLAALGGARTARRGRWAYRLTWPPRLG